MDFMREAEGMYEDLRSWRKANPGASFDEIAEVIEFFESIFIIELKDPEKKLTQTRGRKKGYVYFLDKLSENFKNWEQKRSK